MFIIYLSNILKCTSFIESYQFQALELYFRFIETISVYNDVLFVFTTQLFVGGFMSYLRYLYLLAHSPTHIPLCFFVLFFFFWCNLYVASFSGLSIFDFPFAIL
jgi:hypothetical protein